MLRLLMISWFHGSEHFKYVQRDMLKLYFDKVEKVGEVSHHRTWHTVGSQQMPAPFWGSYN